MHYYRCWAEVDLDALRENLAWLRHRAGAAVKIMTVVKADAYGHGLKQIAALLMQSGTDVFGVANLAEAHAIRSVGKGWPILMLGACLPGEVETAVRDDVMLTISSWEEAEAFSSIATQKGKRLQVHVKVDTGMGRLGVAPHSVIELFRRVEQLGGLTIQGLYTHYASSEDDPEFSAKQCEKFHQVVAEIRSQGFVIPVIHANNSGAVLNLPGSYFDMIRPGLLVYGVTPSASNGKENIQVPVRPALSFHCRVSLVKEVPMGTPLSYGHTFYTPTSMRIATLTAGYGDGYSRAGSNRAEVLIHGKRCRILGRITMDQMLADVSQVPEVKSGDVATLIGRQGDDEITVHEVAQWAGTIPWEVLTGITYRVPRVYRGSHAA